MVGGMPRHWHRRSKLPFTITGMAAQTVADGPYPIFFRTYTRNFANLPTNHISSIL
jgi:hypothetical protein